MDRKIIFFISVYEIGLTGQLTEQAITFNRLYPDRFVFISGEKEQFKGLHKKLADNGVQYETIAGIDNHAHFYALVRDFMDVCLKYGTFSVMTHTNWQFMIAVVSRHLLSRKYSLFYTIHGYRNQFPVRSVIARFLIGSMLYLFADKVVVPSSFLKNQFSFMGDRNKVIAIGEDDGFFIDYCPPPSDGPINLIYPAAFRPGKKQDLLIRVLKRYIDNNGSKCVHLYLPGEGKRLEYCKRLVQNYGLEKQVSFPGFIARQRMIDLYLKSHYAIIPSTTETFGHCIVEPFLLGRVVITRHVGIADDIIKHGETGFFFDTEDELLELLLTIQEKALYERISQNAIRNRSIFTWEAVCRQHALHIYTDLLSPSN